LPILAFIAGDAQAPHSTISRLPLPFCTPAFFCSRLGTYRRRELVLGYGCGTISRANCMPLVIRPVSPVADGSAQAPRSQVWKKEKASQL